MFPRQVPFKVSEGEAVVGVRGHSLGQRNIPLGARGWNKLGSKGQTSERQRRDVGPDFAGEPEMWALSPDSH